MRARGQSMEVYRDATLGGGETSIEAVQAAARRTSRNERELVERRLSTPGSTRI